MTVSETSVRRRTRGEIAARVARDLRPGSVVNLGIGMPTLVADHLDPANEFLVHSENGILGVGPGPDTGDTVDADLINASKDPVTLLRGGSFFSHADSFAMIRGGHVDVAIMGAFEVSCRGDLANWTTGSAAPAVGGAMDLAVGAKEVVVMMNHQDKTARSKLRRECSLPLTARGVVRRVYTDLAVLRIEGEEFVLIDAVPGATLEYIRSVTDAPVRMA